MPGIITRTFPQQVRIVLPEEPGIQLVFNVQVEEQLEEPDAIRPSAQLPSVESCKGPIGGGERGGEFGFRALAVIWSLLQFGDSSHPVLFRPVE